MKPATRNGLTALIVILLAIGVGVVVTRHRRDDRTRVALAPAVSTTVAPTTVAPTTVEPTTTSPTTETTTTATTAVPTTDAPTTVTATTVAPSPVDAGATSTTVAPATTTPPSTTAVPAADPATVQGAGGEHPHTGRRSLLLPALVLIGAGLAGARLSRRTRPSPTEPRPDQ